MSRKDKFEMKSGFKINKIKFKIREGDQATKLSECAIGGKWIDKTTDDFFKNKRVVLFSLPGALLQHVHPNSYQDLKKIVHVLKN